MLTLKKNCLNIASATSNVLHMIKFSENNIRDIGHQYTVPSPNPSANLTRNSTNQKMRSGDSKNIDKIMCICIYML